MIQKWLMMTDKVEYNCIHEELLQSHSLQLKEHETELHFKKEKLDEIKSNNERMEEKIDDIKDSVNEIILASKRDDSQLKEIIAKQDNRITALETTNKTLKWIVGIGLTGLSVGVGFLAFLITHIH